MSFKERRKGILLVLIESMLWGISGTFAQYLFQQKRFSPEWLVDIRLLISEIILLLYALVKEKGDIYEVWKTKNDYLNILLFAIVGMLSAQYTYFAAIKYGKAATATILQYLSPVIITCYLTLKTKKYPSFQEVIGIILAMLDTFLRIKKGNINSISISKLAVFWGISSAFYCYLESLKYVQPTDASVLSSAEPLSAALLSVLWLNVPLGIAQ